MGLGTPTLEARQAPPIEKLPNGRIRFRRTWEVKRFDACLQAELETKVFQAYGTADGDYAGMGVDTPKPELLYENACLVDQALTTDGSNSKVYLLHKDYETLTSSFVDEVPPVEDRELNGLLRITRSKVALEGTSYTGVIGVTQFSGHKLAKFKVTNIKGKRTVEEVYLESGVLSVLDEDNNNGKLNTVTVRAWDIESGDINAAIPHDLSEHALVDDYEENVNGFPVRFFVFARGEGVISVQAKKLGGAQQVAVTALGLTESEVITALSEVTTNHKLIEVTNREEDGYEAIQYTFEVDDFVKIISKAGDLTVIQRRELSATDFSYGTINSTEHIHPSGTYLLKQEEIDNDGIVKLRIRVFVRFDSNAFPSMPLYEIDRTYGVALPITRSVVGLGEAFGEITANHAVQVQPKDEFSAFQFTALADDVPTSQTWYGRRVVGGFPDELIGLSVVGTESPIIIPEYRQAPSSPLKVRHTRTFHWGPPPEEDRVNERDFLAKPYSAAVEIDVTRESKTNSTSNTTSNNTGTSTSSTTSNNSGTSTYDGDSYTTTYSVLDRQPYISDSSRNTRSDSQSNSNTTSNNAGTSTSNTTSTSETKRVVSVNIRTCLRNTLTVSMGGKSIVVPKTTPTSLPWGEYTVIHRKVTHWKMNVWVEEVIEALLPALS